VLGGPVVGSIVRHVAGRHASLPGGTSWSNQPLPSGSLNVA
jgi:hypothetical protein